MEISFTEKHNDKAPKTPSRQSQEGHGVGPNSSDPLRSMSSSVPEKGQLRILRRSRSNDNIKPDFDDVPTAGCLKRRASVDAAPRTPRRSDTGSLADPFQAVYAMFAKMQDETNAEKRPEGKVDGAPTVPRRSMDNIGSGNIMDEIVNDNENGEDDDDDDGKQVKSRRKSRSSDGAPTAPRRSRDSVEFADILDEVYMMEPFPSSVDNQNGDKSVDNVPPQNLRASRKSDSDNKEFLASTLDVSSSGSVFDSQVEEASLLLQQDHEDDESTVLTMGKLGPLYQTKK